MIPLPTGAEVEVLPFGLTGEFTRRYPPTPVLTPKGEGYRHLDVRTGGGHTRRPPPGPTQILPTAEVFPGQAVAAVKARLDRLDLSAPIPTGAGSVVLLHVHQETSSRARLAVRLSFRTDRIIFPYQEPSDVGADARRLTAWIVSESPVELLARDGRGNVNRPWRAYERYKATRSAVRAGLGRHHARLPGQGVLWIQTFREEKADRAGYGPIVGVSETWTGAGNPSLSRLLGGDSPDPVFARVLEGRTALSELPLRDAPRRRVQVDGPEGAVESGPVVDRIRRLFAGCSIAAKTRPVIEFMVSSEDSKVAVSPVAGGRLHPTDARCLSARAAGVSAHEDWLTSVLRVRLSRR